MSTPPPPLTYPLREVVRLTGLTRRAIRYYLSVRMLPAPKARGSATAYSRDQLLRLHAIRLMRQRDHLGLPKVRQRLAAMSLADLEAFVATDPALPRPPPPPPPPAAFAGTTWIQTELIAGLELRLRADAGAIVQRLAREIVERYAAVVPPATPG